MLPKRAVAHIDLEVLWEHHLDKARLSNDGMQHLSRCTDCLCMLGVCQISGTLEEARRYYAELSGESSGARS